MLSVYSLQGQLIYRRDAMHCVSTEQHVPLLARGFDIVVSGERTVKAVYYRTLLNSTERWLRVSGVASLFFLDGAVETRCIASLQYPKQKGQAAKLVPLSCLSEPPDFMNHMSFMLEKSPDFMTHMSFTLEKSPDTVKHMLFTLEKSPDTVKHMLFTQEKPPDTIKHMSFTQEKSPDFINHMSFTKKKSPDCIPFTCSYRDAGTARRLRVETRCIASLQFPPSPPMRGAIRCPARITPVVVVAAGTA
jgi:hypothetical protein